MGMTGWFRWYRGTSNDSKLHLVAKRSQQPMAVVVAVWAMLLERASENESSGSLKGFDAEVADLNLDLPEGTTSEVLQAMADKGMIANNCIVNWRKRQPLREDPTAAERKRQQRAREKEECHTMSHNVTQCHTMSQSHDQENCDNRDVTQDFQSHNEAKNSDQKEEEKGEETKIAQSEGSSESETDQGVVGVSHNVTQGHAMSQQNRIEENRIKEKDNNPSDCSPEQKAQGQSTEYEQPLLVGETEIPKEHPFIVLPLIGGDSHSVMRADVAELALLYQGIDVEYELRRMKGWLEANPKRRKTKNGIKRFISTWLIKEQNSNRTRQPKKAENTSALAQCAI